MPYVITIAEETPSAQSGLLTDRKELYRQVLNDIYGPEGVKKIIRRINADSGNPSDTCSVCGVAESRCAC